MTHPHYGDKLLYSEATDLNVNLIQKTLLHPEWFLIKYLGTVAQPNWHIKSTFTDQDSGNGGIERFSYSRYILNLEQTGFAEREKEREESGVTSVLLSYTAVKLELPLIEIGKAIE